MNIAYLKLLIKSHRTTIKQLANDVGVSQSAMYKYVSGAREPKRETEVKIAQRFGLYGNKRVKLFLGDLIMERGGINEDL